MGGFPEVYTNGSETFRSRLKRASMRTFRKCFAVCIRVKLGEIAGPHNTHKPNALGQIRLVVMNMDGVKFGCTDLVD